MDRKNNDKKTSSSKGQKKICQSRMPKAQRNTCRHYLGARCIYGRDACNFPHREDELPAHLVEAARQLEEEVQTRARYSPVFYNTNGNITYHHGDYVSHGDYANSSTSGAYNQAPSRYLGPPPYYPAGANWGPPQFHHHHPPGPPTGFIPYWDPAPAHHPGFEPGHGYGLPLPPVPANPEHWPAEAAAAALPEPRPEPAPIPNTAPASVTDSKENHRTTRCWHGRNCKKPGCHYLHDGDVTASSNGNGNDNGNGEGSSSSGTNNALENHIQDAMDNGPENGGVDLGNGNDDSASWAGDVARPPSSSPTDQSSEAVTPQSSPRQLPASVAGDVTPPTLEHTSEEHSEEEADTELSTIEEETPKAQPEEEHSEDEEGELSTVEQQTPETPSEGKHPQEEVDVPAPAGEAPDAETPTQPPARRGPLVVSGRSGWGLRKVKDKQRAV
ncbi:hypothetical protein BDP55DRAFT_770602 [Colletotrichum godetiae]|uniref:C3H1-type domain-containing protein n=1 Tax=Colletotrichum godetiae TaxID=1209918 RepID=A0AAJ0AF78_9PEZI|nr:uncharacterized protein BDP55DRAFT_770602 [Colletotrichum godetiae]KAK1672784.1 hypothetical protein BDP55DRAFT_770602 [Colletotrichum godetiae]